MLISIDPNNPQPEKIAEAVASLQRGGVVVYPTDTVYSIGCDILNSKAIEQVARLKNVRTDRANFSLICFDLSHISEYCRPIPNPVFKLMKQLLPGPYTFILEANRNIPKIFSERKKTIGIRVPDNDIARQLVKQLGRPIVAASVHDEDAILEYTTDPQAIHQKFGKQVDMVIDGGAGGLEASTVLDCTGNEIKLVRQGKGDVSWL